MHGGTGVHQAAVKGVRLGIKFSKLPGQENALVNVKSGKPAHLQKQMVSGKAGERMCTNR